MDYSIPHRIRHFPLGMGRIFSDQWGDFNGSIDDLRIFSTEIDSAQVSSLYNSGNGDFAGTTTTSYDTGRVKVWKDQSVNEERRTKFT